MGIAALGFSGLMLAASAAGLETSWRGLADVISSSGIDFVNVSGDREKHVILSSLGGGAALFDYDGDGDLDLYFVNGVRLADRVRVAEGTNRLYRNEGQWRFSDVTAEAGVGDEGWGVGAAVGDYDNDGLSDLYVTNIGANVLYRNQGDGSFVDVTAEIGGGDPGFGASAAFFDAEEDGDLDLYVANYVEPDLEKIPEPGAEPTCLWLGMAVMCGPRGLNAQRDVFYRNDFGRLVEAAKEAGLVASIDAFGLGVVSGDYDDDGDLDLYVANDTHPNFLFENDGTGHFSEIGLLSGAGYNDAGDTEAGMGVDFGDPNGDGWLDLFVTNFSHETNTLYLGSEAGLFTDATDELGVGTPSLGRLGWGTRFVDLDNDGDEDLFVANGHVYPKVAEVDATTSYRQNDQVFLNRGDGVFEEAGPLSRDGASAAASRGAAFGDVDDDGDVDVIVVGIDDRPALLRNELEAPGEGTAHWVGLELVGRESSRDAYGARVWIVTAPGAQLREVRSSGSIFSSSDPRLHVGLGSEERVKEIRIRWPSGRTTRLTGVAAGRYHLVVEGVDPP